MTALGIIIATIIGFVFGVVISRINNKPPEMMGEIRVAIDEVEGDIHLGLCLADTEALYKMQHIDYATFKVKNTKIH